MAFLNRPSSVARLDLIITENRFLIHYMQEGIRKLQKKFDHDATVGSKVIALSNRLSSLARPDLIMNENRFLIHCMEKGILKLQ